MLAEQAGDRLPSPPDGVRQHRIQATLHSHRLGVLAAQAARAHGVTVPAVLMGLLAAALAEHLGEDRVAVSLMSSNRFAPEHRHVVTTMNQLIPVLVGVDHGATLAEHISRAHWAAAKAYRYSSYDLDQILAVAAETGAGGGFTSLFRCWFNYLQLDAEPLGAGQDTPAELVWTPLARQHGQPFDVRVSVREGRTSVALRTDPQLVPAGALTGMLRMLSLGVERAATDPASTVADLWKHHAEPLPVALFPADPPGGSTRRVARARDRPSDQHLDRGRVAEKARRAGGQAVGAGLEHRDQIADLGHRQLDVVAEQVQRGAQRAHHGHRLGRRLGQPVGHRDRVVAPDRLAEVARSGQLVMHPAVDDQERLAPRLLAVHHPGDVHAASPTR